MPAALIASKATGVVRKWNSLGCAVPREVTAVSMLTIVRSASDSVDTIGPNADPGSSSSLATRSSKCTSPAKFRVMSPPVAGADGEADAAPDTAADGGGAGKVATGEPDGEVPQPAAASTPASAATAGSSWVRTDRAVKAEVRATSTEYGRQPAE